MGWEDSTAMQEPAPQGTSILCLHECIRMSRQGVDWMASDPHDYKSMHKHLQKRSLLTPNNKKDTAQSNS